MSAGIYLGNDQPFNFLQLLKEKHARKWSLDQKDVVVPKAFDMKWEASESMATSEKPQDFHVVWYRRSATAMQVKQFY